MYADDLLVMSSSFVTLQCMIDINIDYGLIMGIIFGHVKSVIVSNLPTF